MIYECAYCNKLYDEKDGVMNIEEIQSFIGGKPIYIFRCKNCMSEKLKKNFEKFKKKDEKNKN